MSTTSFFLLFIQLKELKVLYLEKHHTQHRLQFHSSNRNKKRVTCSQDRIVSEFAL